MHRILRETHKKENIDLLKARDAYFDKARKQNNRYRTICLMTPIILSLAGTIIIVISHFYSGVELFRFSGEFLDQYLEIIVGITALVTFLADCIVTLKISDNLSHSNRLRELYDCKVLRIDENHFLYCDLDTTVAEDLKFADGRADSAKYEVWYRETFSDNECANALCAMMDNVIYTYYIYAAYRKRLGFKLALYMVIFVLYTLCFLLLPYDITLRLINPFILFLAVFDRIKDLVSSYLTSKDLEKTNVRLKENVLKFMSREDISNDAEKKRFMLRELQDVIAQNRDKSLFVPKSIRDKYLENGNEYYRDLDEIKNIFWEKAVVEKPVYPSDYEIPSLENESIFVSLESVHKELLYILQDVKRVLDAAGIHFMLDGGTLIGSIRESHHGFLAWDDDVDLSLRESDVKQAIRVIQRELGDKYEVQDCSTEEYYSPRLSRFRVRQKNEISRVNEKDSELYELYNSRGLFLDVYSYCPVLLCRPLDAIYRRMMFYPLYKKLIKVESNWKYGSILPARKEKELCNFVKLKFRFQRRTARYLHFANCMKYYSYTPGYIENLKKAGPYIKAEDIYGIKNIGIFESIQFEIPSRPDRVLFAFYGKHWDESPYKSLKSIDSGGWYSFSNDTFDATRYKHLKNVSLYR